MIFRWNIHRKLHKSVLDSTTEKRGTIPIQLFQTQISIQTGMYHVLGWTRPITKVQLLFKINQSASRQPRSIKSVVLCFKHLNYV